MGASLLLALPRGAGAADDDADDDDGARVFTAAFLAGLLALLALGAALWRFGTRGAW